MRKDKGPHSRIDAVEGYTNGNAVERRSAYAEASASAEASARQVGGSSTLPEYAVMHGDEAEATVVLPFGQRSGGRWMGIGL